MVMLKVYLMVSIITATDAVSVASIEMATLDQCAQIRNALIESYMDLRGGYDGTHLACIETNKAH